MNGKDCTPRFHTKKTELTMQASEDQKTRRPEMGGIILVARNTRPPP